MDPFIEGYGWPSFHLTFLARTLEHLVVQLPENYLISAEIGITANDLISGKEKFYRPDLGIMETDPKKDYFETTGGTATVTPPKAYVPIGDVKQRTLTIRTAGSEELVTAIELLSPVNKRSMGLKKYREKREELIRNEVHLVELDLLRGGTPPVLAEDWPAETYRFQSVDAVENMIAFWSVRLDEALPSIPVPLLPGDNPLVLDLQEVFEKVYQFSTYSRSLVYKTDKLVPPATTEEKEMLNAIL